MLMNKLNRLCERYVNNLSMSWQIVNHVFLTLTYINDRYVFALPQRVNIFDHLSGTRRHCLRKDQLMRGIFTRTHKGLLTDTVFNILDGLMRT